MSNNVNRSGVGSGAVGDRLEKRRVSLKNMFGISSLGIGVFEIQEAAAEVGDAQVATGSDSLPEEDTVEGGVGAPKDQDQDKGDDTSSLHSVPCAQQESVLIVQHSQPPLSATFPVPAPPQISEVVPGTRSNTESVESSVSSLARPSAPVGVGVDICVYYGYYDK
ncbi:hypothetical protein VKT23_008094 [Stygiomarasmius scandens]|uniref:Uncharacterized protein n=1 Tax=Marasmiellus scandens TaxID=2682957 RepID=A0ABR1JHV4_9AGAR